MINKQNFKSKKLHFCVKSLGLGNTLVVSSVAFNSISRLYLIYSMDFEELGEGWKWEVKINNLED